MDIGIDWFAVHSRDKIGNLCRWSEKSIQSL
jgi:hypothetical protein